MPGRARGSRPGRSARVRNCCRRSHRPPGGPSVASSWAYRRNHLAQGGGLYWTSRRTVQRIPWSIHQMTRPPPSWKRRTDGDPLDGRLQGTGFCRGGQGRSRRPGPPVGAPSQPVHHPREVRAPTQVAVVGGRATGTEFGREPLEPRPGRRRKNAAGRVGFQPRRNSVFTGRVVRLTTAGGLNATRAVAQSCFEHGKGIRRVPDPGQRHDRDGPPGLGQTGPRLHPHHAPRRLSEATSCPW